MAGKRKFPSLPVMTFSPELGAKIVDAVRKGNFIETAAKLYGVYPDTVRDWLYQGAKGREEYAAFALEVQKATAESETSAQDIVRMHGLGDFKAAAWWLERRFPGRWALNIRAEVTKELKAVMARLESRLPPEVFQQVALVLSDDQVSGEGVLEKYSDSAAPWEANGDVEDNAGGVDTGEAGSPEDPA